MKKVIFGFVLLFTALNVHAGDELKEQPQVFSYWEGCWAINSTQKVDIMGLYFPFFPYKFHGFTFAGEHACDSFYSKVFINRNYSPNANFTILSQEPEWSGGVNRVKISSTSTDRDGDIAEYTWWVNGFENSEKGSTLSIKTFKGGYYDIKLKVKDNGILNVDPDTGNWLNDKERYFHQKDTVEKTVYLLPHYCENPCVID